MGSENMSKREKYGLALLASAVLVGGKLFYDYVRRGKWGRFW